MSTTTIQPPVTAFERALHARWKLREACMQGEAEQRAAAHRYRTALVSLSDAELIALCQIDVDDGPVRQ